MAKKKDATKQGASEITKIPDDRITPQIQAHNDLAERHRKRRENGQDDLENLDPAVELPEDLKATEIREEEPEKIETESAEEDVPAEAQEEAEEVVIDEPEEELITIKVDGEEKRVTLTEAIEAGKRTLQKESAADKRLKEAVDKVKEADQLLEDAKKRSQEIKAVPDEPEKTELNKKELAEFVHLIRYGDDDEATEAAAQLLSNTGAKATGLSKEDVENLVETRTKDLAERQRFESALDQVRKPPEEGGFGDLFDDGVLQNAFGFQDEKLQQEHPDWSYEKRMRIAGETIREKFHLNPTQESPNNGSRNEQRKAQIKRTPTATSVNTKVDAGPVKTERERFRERLNAEQQQRRPI